MMTEREKMAARIRGLRAKTVEAGCTEAEAMAAAELVAKLLAAYNMTLDEADLRASPFERHDETHEDDVGARLWKPAQAISKLTGVTFWTSSAGVRPHEVHFFGFAHEVDVASYLMEICARAMRTQRDAILLRMRFQSAVRQRVTVRPFLDGMADRLYERILELVPPPPPPGTGLVVLRAELILAALRDTGVTLQDGRPSSGVLRPDPNYDAGRRAAEGVALNPGLTSSAGGGAQARLA